MSAIYPLTLSYPADWRVKAPEISVTITRDFWAFTTDDDRERFQALPVARRLELRSAFATQVKLANDTK